jgi:hypothetical protein
MTAHMPEVRQARRVPTGGEEMTGDDWNATAADFQGEEILTIAAHGRKDDTGKLPYHLLAPEMLSGTAAVLDFGARKYAPRNWELGMAWSRPFSALMRHMWAWWRGDRADPESGMSHLWHAACCLMFLMAYEQRRLGSDDRPAADLAKATRGAQ